MKIIKQIWLPLFFLGIFLGWMPDSLSGKPENNRDPEVTTLIKDIPHPLHGGEKSLLNDILSTFELDEDEDETHDNKPVSEGIFTFHFYSLNQTCTIWKLIPLEVADTQVWLRFLVLRL